MDAKQIRLSPHWAEGSIGAPVAERDTTSGPIIAWFDYGVEGWKPRSFDTAKEALLATRYGDAFLLTRLVQFDVQEK